MISEQLRSIKSFVVGAMGPAGTGRLDYFLKPYLRGSWGGPMNAQLGRVNLCRDIITSLRPVSIVETGTFRGTTTKFLAEFGIPVHSVESDPRVQAFAQLNLRSVRDRVHLSLSDSSTFLSGLARDPSFPKESVFFYLDAHRVDDDDTSDLPLANEINAIFSSFTRSIIMIDDFAVPGDSYSYDDYGPGAVLEAAYLDALGRTDMFRFYPSLPAYKETGLKRGCIVLCNDEVTRDRLAKLESLRAAA